MNKTLRVCFLGLMLLGVSPLFAQYKAYSLPDKKGLLRITPGQLGTADVQLVDDDNQLRAKWEASSLGLYMTAFVQNAEKPGGSKVLRDTWWPQTERIITGAAKIKDKRLYEKGDVALVEYIVPKIQGRDINQKHVHAYVAGGDIWAEVHISKVEFKAEDQGMFDAIVDSISIVPDYVNNSRDYWRFGAIASNRGDYRKTADYFQRSLDLDKSTPVLDKAIFRKMMAELGYLYQKLGDLPKAQSTLEYGISKHPDYAILHYNLASVFAERAQLDQTLEELRLAYKYKNSLSGDDVRFPDPLTDKYFAALASDQKFVTAVRQMQQQ